MDERRLVKDQVDPRVGGGDNVPRKRRIAATGRSPRGRGRRLELGSDLEVGRSIPAWAGETGLTMSLESWWRVDPRVGGGDFGCRTL